ncbi:UDP-glycosyltransferase 88F3 [Jatropha curcas]|uniref:UDP-glycosyltransferase 88F3 n=1 Tax=Jatropha curcas TaxID=180498 RepID=UPI001893A5DD|nr:UDP-glycosyltransferase 88F3 [Jatropha curcas]
MEDTIVLYPSPGLSHIVSMVELAKLILHHANHYFSITILLITSNLWNSPTIASYIDNISQSHPSISFRRFPPVSVDPTPPRSYAVMVFETILLNKPYVLNFLQEIKKERNVCSFIIDIFCTSALSLGKQLKVPTYYYFTSGAACLGAFLYFPRVHNLYKEKKSFKDLKETVLDFPHMPPLKAIHIPEPMLDRDDPAYNDMLYYCSHLSKSDGIMINTFPDLEPNAIKKIEDGLCVEGAKTPPLYCVGPVISRNTGKKEPKDSCLSWLDMQPRKSVVFLCFGSRGSFSVEQVKEIANGLEKSGERFLWVVKNPPLEDRKQTEDIVDFDLEAILPKGFLNRVKDRGLVVKFWAQQMEVLSHDSVGGFVTHCGWNSVIEAVVTGVPMLAWPLYAEQHLNRNALVEDMKMAIGVEQRDEDGFVTGDELAKRVSELMNSDNGRELRERSTEMKEKSVSVWAESGSSTRALTRLVDFWRPG